MDYNEVLREFDLKFSGRHVYRGRIPFYGKSPNFMTPTLLGYVTTNSGDIVEVSTGMGFRNDRIFGVTWPRVNDKSDDRSCCVYSLEEAVDLIESF